ncbi:hypothetical protein V8C40DRAFT_107458 [Trichoderma camerunense]
MLNLNIQVQNKRRTNVPWFESDLMSSAVTERLDDVSIDILFQALSQLLKAFAMKTGGFGIAQINRDVMVFVRRYRNLVNVTAHPLQFKLKL